MARTASASGTASASAPAQQEGPSVWDRVSSAFGNTIKTVATNPMNPAAAVSAGVSGMMNPGGEINPLTGMPTINALREKAMEEMKTAQVEQSESGGDNWNTKDKFVWEYGETALEELAAMDYRFNPPLHPSIRPNNSGPFALPLMVRDSDGNIIKENPDWYLKGELQNDWPVEEARNGRDWRLGQLIADNQAGLAYGQIDQDYRYGFRFLYNPSNITFSVAQNKTVPRNAFAAGTSTPWQGTQQISLELMLNRIPEVTDISEEFEASLRTASKEVDPSEVEHASPDDIAEALRTQGTMLDIDYLYRVTNGVFALEDGMTQPIIIAADDEEALEEAKKRLMGPNYEIAKAREEAAAAGDEGGGDARKKTQAELNAEQDGKSIKQLRGEVDDIKKKIKDPKTSKKEKERLEAQLKAMEDAIERKREPAKKVTDGKDLGPITDSLGDTLGKNPIIATRTSSAKPGTRASGTAQGTTKVAHHSRAGSVPNKQNAQKIWNIIVSDWGLPEHAAAGIMGNLQQESGFDPTIIQPNGVGHGLAQWSKGGRWDNGGDSLVAWAKKNGNKNPKALQTQMDFMFWEMKNKFPGLISKLKNSKDAMDATRLFHGIYEKSADSAAAVDSVRGGNAKNLLQTFKGTASSSGGGSLGGQSASGEANAGPGGSSGGGNVIMAEGGTSGYFLGSEKEPYSRDDLLQMDYNFPINVQTIATGDGRLVVQGVLARKSGDIGYMMATPCWLTIGTAFRYIVWPLSYQYQHIMFSKNMVPMLTRLTITFARLIRLTSEMARNVAVDAAITRSAAGDIFQPIEREGGGGDEEGGGKGGGGAGQYPADHKFKDVEKGLDLPASGITPTGPRTNDEYGQKASVSNTVAALRAIAAEFPEIKEVGGKREADAYHGHPSGLALDIVNPNGGIGTAWGEDNPLPNKIIKFFESAEGKKRFGTLRTIFYNGGDVTHGHRDHIHLDLNPYADYDGRGALKDGNRDIVKGSYWDEDEGGGGMIAESGFASPGEQMNAAGCNQGQNRDYGGHTGEDFNLPSNGSPLFAFSAGTVTSAGGNIGAVCVRNGDFRWRYLHCVNIRVSTGDKVKAGQKVAQVGGAGGYTPHLHMDTWFGGSTTSPPKPPRGPGKSSSLSGHNKSWWNPLEILRAAGIKVDADTGTGGDNSMSADYSKENINHLKKKLGIGD